MKLSRIINVGDSVENNGDALIFRDDGLFRGRKSDSKSGRKHKHTFMEKAEPFRANSGAVATIFHILATGDGISRKKPLPSLMKVDVVTDTHC